jgi:hypothetical protein
LGRCVTRAWVLEAKRLVTLADATTSGITELEGRLTSLSLPPSWWETQLVADFVRISEKEEREW